MAWTSSITWDPRLDSFAYSDDSDEEDNDDDNDDDTVARASTSAEQSHRSDGMSRNGGDQSKYRKVNAAHSGVARQQGRSSRATLRSERPMGVPAVQTSSTTLELQGTTVKPQHIVPAVAAEPSTQKSRSKEGGGRLCLAEDEKEEEEDDDDGQDLIAAFAHTILRRARERIAWTDRIDSPDRSPRRLADKEHQEEPQEQRARNRKAQGEQQSDKERSSNTAATEREMTPRNQHEGDKDSTTSEQGHGLNEDDNPLLQHVLQLEDAFATIEEERRQPPTWPLNRSEEGNRDAAAEEEEGPKSERDTGDGWSGREQASSGNGEPQATDWQRARTLRSVTRDEGDATERQLESDVQEHLKRLQQQQAEARERARRRAAACLQRHVHMWWCRQKHLPALADACESAARAKEQRRQRSARYLQACILMRLAQTRHLPALQAARRKFRRAIVDLQAHCRGFAVRALFHDGLREAFARGRSRFKQSRQRQAAAATTIQAAWRGHAWRSSHPDALRRIADGVAERQANREAAAVCIQRVVCMHLARRQYGPVVAARRREAEARRKEEQQRLQQERRARAAQVIARVWLAYVTRRQHWPQVQRLHDDRAAAQLQCVCRGFLARKAQARKRAAIVRIQAMWRGYRMRQRLARAMQRVAAFHANDNGNTNDNDEYDDDDDDDLRALLNEACVFGNAEQDLDLTAFEEELISGVQAKVVDKQQQQRVDKGPTQGRARLGDAKTGGGDVQPRLEEGGVTDDEAEKLDGRAYSAEMVNTGVQRGGRGPREAASAEVRRTCDRSPSVADSQALLRSWTEEQVKRETRKLPPVRTASTPPSTASSSSSSSQRRARLQQRPRNSAPVAGRGGARGRARRRRATAGSIATANATPAPLGNAIKESHWFKGPKQEPGRVTAQHVPQLRRARRAQMAKRMRAFGAAQGGGAQQ